ncbi:MAG: hypothetical protein H6619_00570 [Deltaproteobacteria bacterium]|nr:hypothetical protein [Deltaproteobacteria bacterium]
MGLQKRLVTEKAYAATLFAGVIFLMVIGTSVGINSVLYYMHKNKLEGIAKEMAAYGATFLPNPVETILQANAILEFKKQELHESNPAAGSSNISATYYISSALGEFKQAPSPEILSASPPPEIFPTVASPPIKSITIKLRDSFEFNFFNITSLSSLPLMDHLNVVAEVTMQLVPTDIVLVIESSNSLISFMESELEGLVPTIPDAFELDEWQRCEPYASQRCKEISDGDAGKPWSGICPNNIANIHDFPDDIICASKALRYTRQCFGQVAINLKRAAITLYDLLSMSGTYRVGVVHNSASAAEQAQVTVPLLTHPYRRYSGNVSAGSIIGTGSGSQSSGVDTSVVDKNYGLKGIIVNPNFTPSFQALDPSSPTEIPKFATPATTLEQVYGGIDHPSTRCAAATSESEYYVPAHPFSKYFDPSYETIQFPKDLHQLPRKNGSTFDSMPTQQSYAADPERSHLRFKASGSGRYDPEVDLGDNLGVRLLPREMIWMKNSGYTFHNGVPIPRYNYNSIKFGILRAAEMLFNAPERGDKLPVRRRIILVLNDGTDGYFPAGSSAEVGWFDQTEAFNPRHITLSKREKDPNAMVIDLKDLFNTSGTDKKSICSIGSEVFKANNVEGLYRIDDRTSPKFSNEPNLNGYKLGVLHYGFAGKNYGLDQDGIAAFGDGSAHDLFQDKLDFHTDTDESITRNLCDNHWTSKSSKFWAEASSVMTSDPLNKPYGYTAVVAPFVARSVFESEVVE